MSGFDLNHELITVSGLYTSVTIVTHFPAEGVPAPPASVIDGFMKTEVRDS